MNLEQIKENLSTKPKIFVSSPYKRAAVALVLHKKNGKWFLIFTKRSENLSNHAGEISFMGGKIDETDRDLVETSIRETEEEIGVKLCKNNFLGSLNDMITITKFHITPYVFWIENPQYLLSEDEVDEIIEIPLEYLLRQNQKEYSKVVYMNRTWNRIAYEYDNKIIWGATASILNDFLSSFS